MNSSYLSHSPIKLIHKFHGRDTNPILRNNRYLLIHVSIITERELPHEFANPSHHSQVLHPTVLIIFVALPHTTHHSPPKRCCRSPPAPLSLRHVHHEHVAVRILRHVSGRRRRHGFRVSYVSPRRVALSLLLFRFLCQIQHVFKDGQHCRIQTHVPYVHS